MEQSRIPWFYRIKVRVLLISILISVVPALIIGMYFLYFAKQDLEKSVQAQNESTAERFAQKMEFFLFRTEERLKTTRFSLLSAPASEDKQAILYRMLKKVPLAEEAVIFNHEGKVAYGVHRFQIMQEDGGESWQAEALLRELKQKKEYYGPVQFQQNNIPYMQIAVPVFSEDGKIFRGGVGVKVRLQSVLTLLEEMSDKREQAVFIFDPEGNLIGHSDFTEVLQRKKVNESFVVRHFMQVSNPKLLPIPSRYVSYSGREVLGVYATVPRTGWGIAVEEPVESAFAPVRTLFFRLLAFLLLIVLGASIISIFLGLSFTGPIEYLEKVARSVGRGQTKEPIFTRRKDEIGHLITVFGEMAERLESQGKKLLQEKERLDAIVNSMGIGLALITRDCRIAWTNHIVKEWLGEGITDKKILCYQALKGTPAICGQCPLQGSENETLSADRVTRLMLTNKERIFRHNVYQLRYAAEGEPDYLLVIEDITEQRRMEDIAMQADKLSALGLMASGFAHEINNPLATIQVYAEELVDQVQMKQGNWLGAQETERYLNIICKHVGRAKEITQKLLNFSRKSEWREEYIYLPNICKESVALQSHAFTKKQAVVSLSIEQNVPYIKGDALQVTQVFVNLLQNALDAIDEQGTITVKIQAKDGYVQVHVIDDGSGISPANAGKIYDPFFTTKPVGQGTGLGLSICYGIITRMRGTITVKGTEVQGTTATIELPAIRKEIQDEQEEHQSTYRG